MGLFRSSNKRSKGSSDATPTFLSFSTANASPSQTGAHTAKLSRSLPTTFATSVEALAVAPDSPAPGPGSAYPALEKASSRSLPIANGPASAWSRTDPSPSRLPNGTTASHGPTPGVTQLSTSAAAAALTSSSSSAPHPSRPSPRINGAAARGSPQLNVPPPNSMPLPQHPFTGANGRSHSDTALPERPRASYLHPNSSMASSNGVGLGSNGGPKSLSKMRPNSFLGFLSGGSASRTSVLSATSTVTSNGKKSSKTAKPGKVQSTQAVAVGQAPSRKGPSRVVAIVGNVRTGIGRMIIEELVRNRTIVVALTDAHDGQFGKDLEALALSPSLFHAFPMPNLFGPAFVPQASTAANGGSPSEYFSSPSASTPNLSVGSTGSDPSLNHTPPNLGSTTSFSSVGKKANRFSKASPSASKAMPNMSTSNKLSAAAKAFNERHACLIELANIFKSYRVDTVLTVFEPRDRHATSKTSAGGRSAPAKDDEGKDAPATQQPATVPPLPAAQERARIEEMERVCLQAAIECGAGRFASCACTTSLFPTPLSTVPSAPPDHVRRAPLSVTVFRWGVLMNELAAGVPPNEVGDTALGKWLDPPGKRSGRFVVDFGKSTAYIPQVQGKGKGTEGVSLTLAEDVARFITLACKMKTEWEWGTGTMVGERIRGGWEEVIDMLDTTCRYNFKREYVTAPLSDPSPNSSSDHLGANAPQFHRTDTGDSSDSSSSESPEALTMPGRRERSPADLDDALRGVIATEGLDASSVRLGEFLRVWFSPRTRTAGLTPPVHGPRAMRPMGSMEGMNGRGGGRTGSGEREHRQPRGPPPARSSGAGTGGAQRPRGSATPNGTAVASGGAAAMKGGARLHPASMAPAVRSPLAQSA